MGTRGAQLAPQRASVSGGAAGVGPPQRRGAREPVITGPRREQRFGNGFFRGQLLQQGFLCDGSAGLGPSSRPDNHFLFSLLPSALLRQQLGAHLPFLSHPPKSTGACWGCRAAGSQWRGQQSPGEGRAGGGESASCIISACELGARVARSSSGRPRARVPPNPENAAGAPRPHPSPLGVSMERKPQAEALEGGLWVCRTVCSPGQWRDPSCVGSF